MLINKNSVKYVCVTYATMKQTNEKTEKNTTYPSRRTLETRGAAALIPTDGDVIDSRWIGVENRVDEADGGLAGVEARLVDEGEDGAKDWGGGGCAVCLSHVSFECCE